jgi:hypothetical protein
MGYLIFSAFTCFLPDRVCGTNSIPGFHHGVWQKRRSNVSLLSDELSLADGAVEGDEQIPLAVAQKCFDAVGSKQKTLRIFTREEGGFHHCQVDDATIGVHTMFDRIADVQNPRK